MIFSAIKTKNLSDSVGTPLNCSALNNLRNIKIDSMPKSLEMFLRFLRAMTLSVSSISWNQKGCVFNPKVYSLYSSIVTSALMKMCSYIADYLERPCYLWRVNSFYETILRVFSSSGRFLVRFCSKFSLEEILKARDKA